MRFPNAVHKVESEYTDISGRTFLVTKEYDANWVQVGTVITPKTES